MNSLKPRAIEMRKQGLSLFEIAQLLKISKSTTSIWVRDIKLSEHMQQRLIQKQKDGRETIHRLRNTANKENKKSC